MNHLQRNFIFAQNRSFEISPLLILVATHKYDILYIQTIFLMVMNSVQLLGVIFSFMMFTGVTAGTVVFAETDADYDSGHDYKGEFQGKLDQYCKMNENQKQEYITKHDKSDEHVTKMNKYCELDEEGKKAFIEEHLDEYEAYQKSKKHYPDMRNHLKQYCEMNDSERNEYLAKYHKTEDHAEKVNEYCLMDDEQKSKFIEEHRDEYKKHMKEKMMKHKDKKHHMDYERICSLSENERSMEIDDLEKLDRISKWCDMTPEEREEYKKKHHDKKMNSDMSPRLNAMIMNKHNISDERLNEIKMKFKDHYGELTDEQKSELKMKFREYVSSMKYSMTEEQRLAIHERLAEMKAFKEELKEKASELTDEEKQELRSEFIEKAKELKLAWLSPRIQMNAGVDVQDIECREGFTLVVKSSNGVPMCLKADTAIKMIERGIVIPSN